MAIMLRGHGPVVAGWRGGRRTAQGRSMSTKQNAGQSSSASQRSVSSFASPATSAPMPPSFVATPSFPNLRRLREGSPIMRSACPTRCPEEELQELREKLGIRSLVDLRTRDERLGDPLPGWLWDESVRVRKGVKERDAELGDEERSSGHVCLYNVPLYSTHRIMRWVLANAPIWQQPSLVSSFSKVMSVIGLGNADADTIQTYNQALSAHGLKGHNLFLLSKCGMQISAVLQLMTEPHNLPMLVFCSLGKDRTGVISMLALHIAGASREEIYRDFEASSDGLSVVRSDIMKRLERGGLDPDEFISARAELVDDVFEYLDREHGGADKYLDSIGFDAEWRARLREIL